MAREAKDRVKFGKELEILTPKHMLPVVFTQVKTGTTSKNLLNRIRQIMYSLYRAK